MKFKTDTSLIRNYQDDLGRTALHLSAVTGNAKVILSILRFINIEVKDNLGRTALHWAARSDNKQAIITLLEQGANIESVSNYQMTPLHFASTFSSPETIELLIERGANIEAQDDSGRTALYYAIQSGKFEVLKLLLTKDININTQDFSGVKAISWLIKNYDNNQSKVESLELLTSFGAIINDNERKLLNNIQTKLGDELTELSISFNFCKLKKEAYESVFNSFEQALILTSNQKDDLRFLPLDVGAHILSYLQITAVHPDTNTSITQLADKINQQLSEQKINQALIADCNTLSHVQKLAIYHNDEVDRPNKIRKIISQASNSVRLDPQKINHQIKDIVNNKTQVNHQKQIIESWYQR